MRIDTFLFCELAKKDTAGGFTLVGVIPGNEITLPAAAPVILPTLACYMGLGDMAGVREFNVQAEIMQGGEILLRVPRSPTRREDANLPHHSQIFTISPFNPPGPGPFEFRFSLDAGGPVITNTYTLTVRRVPG